MVLWNGGIDGDGNFTWLPADINDLAFENDGAIFGGKGGNGMYDVLIKDSSNFGWCNIDRLMGLPGEKTNVRVKVPAGFDYTNSSVYLAVGGEDNMLGQLDTYDSGTGLFQLYADMVPVGLDIHLIFVAPVNGNYVYSILSVTVGVNSTYIITNNSLISTTSYNQVEAAIMALP